MIEEPQGLCSMDLRRWLSFQGSRQLIVRMKSHACSISQVLASLQFVEFVVDLG
jgi:hypothetical protein